jgi:hypothetical protein
MTSELESPAVVSAFVISGASNSTYRVELVVSGRIAATFPLPAEASGFSAAMAVKSLVNDDVEIVGVAEPEELVDEVEPPLEAELVLEDELLLPQPAATAASARHSTDTFNQPNLILHAPLIGAQHRH